MNVIWKFPLEILDFQEVLMPENAKILSVENQSDNIVLYALVNPDIRRSHRPVYIRGTGHSIGPLLGRELIGTVKTMDGNLMWHVFARR